MRFSTSSLAQQGISRHEAGRKEGAIRLKVLEPSVTGEMGDQEEKLLLAEL